jgi:menaquinone-dependent protoporphyrinogen oxidase
VRVLVTAAGSQEVTLEIGTRIGSVLGERGHQVDICQPNEVVTIDAYDIVVVGSALDQGCWQPEARALVAREVSDLASRPVWLFSSGCDAHDGNGEVDDLMRSTHAFEHRAFADPGEVDPWAVAIADSISSG